MQTPTLELGDAQQIIERALAAAREHAIAIVATIVDSGGHLVAFARMDGVGYMANEVTRRKAVTAGNFRMPTQALAAVGDFDPIAGADIAKNPEICAVAGGMPIMRGGQCVGGLGIGGGRSQQDQAIAEHALGDAE